MKKWLEQANRILVGGHRGCSCEYPENSIEAMREGIRRGADYLEIDVQITMDGIPVIIHDLHLESGTSLVGYVHEHPYSELKEHIMGLCTLREAMEWGRAEGVRFGLELKTIPFDMQVQNMKLIRQIADLIEELNLTGHVFVFGQDYQVLHQLKERKPEITIGIIVPFVPLDPVALMREMDASIYLSYLSNMTPELIGNLQHAGYLVDGSILEDELWLERARDLKINMYETDYPERKAGNKPVSPR